MRDDIVTMTQDAINKYSTWGDRANSLRSMLNQNFGGRWGVSIVYGSPIEYASAYDADPYMKFSIDNFHIDVFQLELLMKTSSETRIGVPGLLTIG
ncbi:hypothetical protein HDE_07429 [Halotydeus destructor]|nr:hypothetical protein HDE_07429 [Halotydeus destructor]